MNKITKRIKKITPVLFSCSVIVTIFSISTEAIASNKLDSYSETIPSTIIVAQDDTTPQNTKDRKQNQPSICIFDDDRFCLARKTLDTKTKEYLHKPSFLGHSLLIISSGILIGTTFLAMNFYAINLSKTWMNGIKNEYRSKFSVETTTLSEQIHESIKTTNCRERLEQQFKEIQIRISRHKELMLYFYRQHFISISMTSGLALIAGISLIFITKEGISNANPALINIFITTSSAGLLYQRLPGIFKQELNREANRSLFLKYSDLGNTILSYAATGKIRDNTQVTSKSFSTQIDTDKFIHFIDRELNRLNQLPIEFDATKVIKITDLQESVNGAFNPNGANDVPNGNNGGATSNGVNTKENSPEVVEE